MKYAHRAIPDVSLDASPASSASEYDSYASNGWTKANGTSLACPLFAAFIAIVDSTRFRPGTPTLTSTGLDNAMYFAYDSVAYMSYFHDITQGNNGNAAGPGYDLVTGIGSPNNPGLYTYLAGVGLG